MNCVYFVIPGALNTPTGGYGYDRRLMAELEGLGWEVRHAPLGEGFPFPAEAVRAEAAAVFAGLPDGALVLADMLGLGALPEVAVAEAGRLRLVALEHHPLGDESGLTAEQAAALHAAEGAALAACAAVVCTSPATAERLGALFGLALDRVAVATPGVDAGPRSPGTGDPPLILSVGSLIARKRHDVLIEALARIADRPWQARIVGSDSLDPACAADLAALVAARGLDGRVELVGARAEVRGEMAAAGIFALASEYEGYGMAFAEAMSQGLPVVACGVGPIVALVPPAAGALVPPGDVAAFAEALAGLLDDPARRRAAAAAAFAAGAQLPGWDRTAAVVAEVLSSVRT